MQLRHTLAIPTALVLAALGAGTLAAGYLVGSHALSDSLRQLERTRLTALHDAVQGRLDAELTRLESVVGVVSHDLRLATLMSRPPADGLDLELQEYLDAVQERSGLGVLFVADRRGRLRYSSGILSTPSLAADDWGLEEALHGDSCVVTESGPEGWQVRGFAPLALDGEGVGVVAGGFQIDAALMEQVTPPSGVRVALATRRGALLGAGLPGVDPEFRSAAVWRTLVEERAPWFQSDPENHRAFSYAPITLAGDTFCLILEAETVASETLLSREKGILARTLGGLLALVVVLGAPVLYFILAPLRRLRTRVVETTTAYVPERMSPGGRGNEIETLENAFEGLVRAVEDHMERRAASDRRARAVVDASPVGIAVVARGRVVFVNDALRRMYGGGGGADLEGRPAQRFVAAEDRPRLRALVRGAVRLDGPGSPAEVMVLGAGGRTFPAMVWLASVAWDGRRALLAFLTDTSELQELRTRLSGAEKMELVGTLAGGVAHDLNNMLGAIVGYPDVLLARLPADSPLRQPVSRIQEAALRASRVVEDLMTLTRRRVRVVEPVDLAGVVGAFLQSPEGEALCVGRAGVRLETSLAPGAPRVEGSPVHLSNLVMNLCSNAFEALPEGGTVTVRVEGAPAAAVPRGGADWDGPWTVLTVADDGVGMQPEELRRIYEPFYTKKVLGRRSGTGLGMAIVWETVRDHGGAIDAWSRPGRGTRFTVYLPGRAGAAAPDSPQAARAVLPRGEGQVVLLVDDEASQRDIGQALLGQLGYRVALAASGEEGVVRFREDGADLVVLDMVMDPGIGGLETYRRLRGLRPGVKAIIASGDASPGLVDQALALGVKSYLKKPFTLEQLAAAVHRGLAG